MRMSSPLGPGVGLAAALAAVVLTAAAPAEQKPLARYVPRDNLVFYAEFAGLDAHADAWRKTAAYRMLHETPVGAMFEDVLAQAVDAGLAGAPEGPRPTGRQVVGALERFARSGLVLGLSGKIGGAEPPKAILVVRDAGGPEVGRWTRQVMEILTRAAGKSERVTREDGRTVTTIGTNAGQGPSWAWWFEGDDLIVLEDGREPNLEAHLETIAGRHPSAVDLPARAELARTADGFEPVLVSFADLSGLPPTPPALGLAGLKGVDSRWGFQGPALLSITRVHAPAPRKGLLGLLDGPTLDRANPLPVPAGLDDFSVVSVDPGLLFDRVVAIAKASDPKVEPMIQQGLDMARNLLGVSVRDELLAQVGPTMAFYIEPELMPIPITPYQSFLDWALHPPKLTAIVEVRDPARFAKTLDTLMDVANRQIEARLKDLPEGRKRVAFRPLKGHQKGYVLDVPIGTFPLPSGVRPTLLLGQKYLAIAISPQVARKALDFEYDRFRAELGENLKPRHPLSTRFPPNLVALNVSDPGRYVPDLVANLPFTVQALAMLASNGPAGQTPLGRLHLDLDLDRLPTADQIRPFLFPGTVTVAVNDRGWEVVSRDSVPALSPLAIGPAGVALLLPAVDAARTAARRAQSVNNIKQMMLAMHNYESSNGHFPAANIVDAEGKPLLSWRVAILPFIEQQELYNQFHLDEPWDSPHNKPLLARMPAIYKSTKAQPADPAATFYQVLTGNGSLFDPPSKGTKIAEVTDGTSNTIAVVEAGSAVPWSKPEDIPFDPEAGLPKLGGPGFPGGFNAGFADGSVRFLKDTIKAVTLKSLITRAGGEVISADDY